MGRTSETGDSSHLDGGTFDDPGRMGEWTDGRMDGWAEGRVGGQRPIFRRSSDAHDSSKGNVNSGSNSMRANRQPSGVRR